MSAKDGEPVLDLAVVYGSTDIISEGRHDQNMANRSHTNSTCADMVIYIADWISHHRHEVSSLLNSLTKYATICKAFYQYWINYTCLPLHHLALSSY